MAEGRDVVSADFRRAAVVSDTHSDVKANGQTNGRANSRANVNSDNNPDCRSTDSAAHRCANAGCPFRKLDHGLFRYLWSAAISDGQPAHNRSPEREYWLGPDNGECSRKCHGAEQYMSNNIPDLLRRCSSMDIDIKSFGADLHFYDHRPRERQYRQRFLFEYMTMKMTRLIAVVAVVVAIASTPAMAQPSAQPASPSEATPVAPTASPTIPLSLPSSAPPSSEPNSLPTAAPPSPQTMSPVILDGCRIEYSGGLLFGTTGKLDVEFTNEGTVTADMVRIRVNLLQGQNNVRDVGVFSPGISIKHRVRNEQGQTMVFPFFGGAARKGLRCSIVMVHFVDGSTWTSAAFSNGE